MRPRNVLTETNDMRKMMGLPLLNENGGHTIDDIKKEILNEDSPAGFSLGMARQGGLTIDEEEVSETTEAEDFRDEGVGKKPLNKEFDEPINEIERAQKMAEERESRLKKNKDPMEDNVMQEQDPDFGEGPLGIDTGIDVGSPQAGDGEGGLGEPADDQVFAEQDAKDKRNNILQCVNAAKKQRKDNLTVYAPDGDTEILNDLIKCLERIRSPLKETGSFAKYNVTEGWYDHKKSYGDDESNDSYSNDSIKKDVRRIISFLTPGEGDEIEGRYMDNIYPAMALQTAEILYGKL